MSEPKIESAPEPFFVRFLEIEEALAVQTDVKAGKPAQTMKAPSDRDEI